MTISIPMHVVQPLRAMLTPRVAPALVFAVLLARWATGLPGEACEVPYFYLSYTEGFIRRALVGTFTLPLLAGRSLGDAMAMIGIVNIIGATLFLGLLAHRIRDVSPLILLAFIASGALPWLANDLGNLDTWILLFAFAAVCGLERCPLAGLALCALAPLVHEGTVFLLLPMLGGLWIAREQKRALVAVASAITLTAVLCVWLFATTDFTWPPLPGTLNPSFVRWELGQTLHQYLALPLAERFHLSWTLLPASVLPCALIAAAVGYSIGWRPGAMVMIGVMITWSVVLVAADTARLLAWGPFTAVALASFALSQRRWQAARIAP